MPEPKKKWYLDKKLWALGLLAVGAPTLIEMQVNSDRAVDRNAAFSAQELDDMRSGVNAIQSIRPGATNSRGAQIAGAVQTASVGGAGGGGGGGGASSGGSESKATPPAAEIIHSIKAESNQYKPSEIRVPQGKRVSITLKSESGTRDLIIPDYSIQFPMVNEGSSISVMFYADRPGNFPFYSSDGALQGRLVVTPK